jgi:hypothetical protein
MESGWIERVPGWTSADDDDRLAWTSTLANGLKAGD